MKDKTIVISDFNGSWDVQMAHKVKATYSFINGSLSITVDGKLINSGFYSVNQAKGKAILCASPDILEIEILTDKFIVARDQAGGYFLFVKSQ